jgi:hypothetical protein
MTGPDPADVAWYESYLAEVAIGGPEPLAGPIEISE